MPSTLLDQALASFGNTLEWPENAILYKSLKEQELLPEVAKYYSVESLLALHDLQGNYDVCRRDNAVFMSPKGTLPFLRVGNHVEDSNTIVAYLEKRGYSLSHDADADVKILIKGMMSLLHTKLVPIELYFTWVNISNQKDSFAKYGYNMPNPLRSVLCWKKVYDVKKFLSNTGWLSKREEEIIDELKVVLQYFSKRLEKNRCVTGEQVSEADVFLYGHLQAILECKLDNPVMRKTVELYPRLTQFCLTFNQVHLGDRSMLWEFV